MGACRLDKRHIRFGSGHIEGHLVSSPVKETVAKENFWLLTLTPFRDSS